MVFPLLPRFTLFSTLLAASSIGVVTGCGNLEPDDGAPIAVLQGELTQASTGFTSAASVRVAVLWTKSGDADDHRYDIALDLPVQPQFPSRFAVKLFSPPPESVMSDATAHEVKEPPVPGEEEPSTPESTNTPGSNPKPQAAGSGTFRLAVGSLVAYEDLNGNGKLDLVDDSATSFVDRIVGANDSMGLLYLEGTIPATLVAQYGLSNGYNIYVSNYDKCDKLAETCGGGEQLDSSGGAPSGSDASCSDPVAQKECERPFYALPISTLFNLPLSNDPKFADMMCKSGGGLSPSSEEPPLPSTEAPGQPGKELTDYPTEPGTFTCSPDGTVVIRKSTCTEEYVGLCTGYVGECPAGYPYQRPTPVPADWPCPAN